MGRLRAPLCAAVWLLSACGGAADESPDAGCGLDCPGDLPDAGTEVTPDAAPGAACDPPGEDVMSVSLQYAELPEEVADAAGAPVTEAEASAAGAVSYEVITEDVGAFTAIPDVVCLPGLETEIVVRWGNLPPLEPPVVTEWADLGGYVAVSEGEIELVRALRWEGPSDPSDPRPRADVVAPQTDPRVLRFTSSIGSGSDGLLLRIRRPIIEPVILVVKVGTAVQTFPLEEHIATHIVSGGWDLPFGQVMIDAYIQRETVGCYAETGRLEGTWTYEGGNDQTAFDGFSGVMARPGGATEPLAFNATDLRDRYGTFTGTLGSAGATVDGYYGRISIFGEFDRRGVVVGRITAASGEVQELFAAYYEDGEVIGSNAFRRVSCDEPGAMHKSWFLF